MLNSISRSALFKLFLALCLLALLATIVPALRAQPQGMGSQVSPADAQAVAAIPDVFVSPETQTVGEADGSVTVTVMLSEAYTDTTVVSVSYATRDISATAGSDYDETMGTLEIPGGELSKTITVPITNDAVDEDSETFALDLLSATNATIVEPDTATLTITDNDTAGIVVDPTNLTLNEAGASGTFNISLNSEPTADVSIGLSTDDSSECTVADSPAVLTSLNWDLGVDVTVTAEDDDIVDGDQTCTVVTAMPTGGDSIYNAINPDDVVVTVSDDDTATIVVDPSTQTISEPNGSANVVFTLTSRPSNPVNIPLSTSNTQCGASDTTVTLNSSNWDIGKSVTVTAVNDAVADGAQTCTLVIGPATTSDDNYLGEDAEDVSFTVNDDDTAGIVVDPTSLTLSEAGTSGTFNISLTSEPTADVSIGLSTDDSSECTVADSPAVLTSVNWNAGVDVTVNPVNDTVVDGQQTCTVVTAAAVSTDGSYGGMNPTDVTVFVNDDDSTSVRFSSASYSVNESGGSATITVTLSTQSLSTVTVDYATGGGTAGAGTDYTAKNGTVTFAPLDTSETFSVDILPDALDEPNETVNLTLSNPSPTSVTIAGTNPATLTILDDDEAPTVRFSDSTYAANENAGSAHINVTLSAPSGQTVSVLCTTADGSATSGSDYGAVSATISFNPGETSKPCTVPILDDLSYETNETVNLSLSGATNATLGTPNSATLVILDNDDPPAVQLSSSSYSVNEGAGSATITATLSAAAGLEVTVDYATSDGSATAGSDYTGRDGTLRFAPGEMVKTFTVPIIDDTVAEPIETFAVALSNPNSAATLGTPNSAQVSIVDNEGPPTVQFSPATFSVNEGLTATISVGLSVASEQTVTVNYTTGDGTATVADGDYVTTGGTLTFAPGEVNKTFAVRTLADQVAGEGDETVNLTLSNPQGAQLGTPDDTAVLTIVDTSGVATVQFSQAGFNVPETDLAGNVTVNLSTPSALTVTVNYTMTDGTATAGEDYSAAAAAANGTLTFVPGQTSRTISVPLFPDEIDEVDETILLALSNPTNAALGVPANSTLTILDDDLPPSVQFAASSQIVSEADGSADMTVQLSGVSGKTVTVVYATADGTAGAGDDYGESSGTLVFSPGERSKTVSVPITDDDVNEHDETFTVALSSPGNSTLGTPDTITVTIFDSDLPIFTYYYPMIFHNYVIGEPNDTCATAYPIEAGRPYSFLPDDQNDWYQFELATSGNLVVEVTNFVPRKGQVAVYKGETCASAEFLANYGTDGLSKTVRLGQQTAGHYYIYVSNDGVFNDTTPYKLYVRFP